MGNCTKSSADRAQPSGGLALEGGNIRPEKGLNQARGWGIFHPQIKGNLAFPPARVENRGEETSSIL